LLWLSVLKDEPERPRNDFEDVCLARLTQVLPEGVALTILADRGFGDTKLFDFVDTLGSPMSSGFAAISMSARAMGKRVSPQRGSAREDERASKLQGAEVTGGPPKVGAVVCVKAKDMKIPGVWPPATRGDSRNQPSDAHGFCAWSREQEASNYSCCCDNKIPISEESNTLTQQIHCSTRRRFVLESPRFHFHSVNSRNKEGSRGRQFDTRSCGGWKIKRIPEILIVSQ